MIEKGAVTLSPHIEGEGKRKERASFITVTSHRFERKEKKERDGR